MAMMAGIPPSVRISHGEDIERGLLFSQSQEVGKGWFVEGAHRAGSQPQCRCLKVDILPGMTGFHMGITNSFLPIMVRCTAVNSRYDQYHRGVRYEVLAQTGLRQIFYEIRTGEFRGKPVLIRFVTVKPRGKGSNPAGKAVQVERISGSRRGTVRSPLEWETPCAAQSRFESCSTVILSVTLKLRIDRLEPITS